MKAYASIDEYIATFPKTVQEKLQKIKKLIQDTAPEATEDFKYGMPTFRLLDRNLVHFAAYENHIGFYPTPSGVLEFEKMTDKYETSKGAIQFPIDDPIPYDLIEKVVKFRVDEVVKNQVGKK